MDRSIVGCISGYRIGVYAFREFGFRELLRAAELRQRIAVLLLMVMMVIVGSGVEVTKEIMELGPVAEGQLDYPIRPTILVV